MNGINSPVEKINFNGFELYVKRDDLLSHDFSGNKARKFLYFLEHDFSKVKKLVSYGSAQANSLYSLAVLAQQKRWQLDFYVNHIASYLKNSPVGNYKAALNLGANIIEKKGDMPIHDYVLQCIDTTDETLLFLEEGGRVKEAQYGIKKLALEIIQWAKDKEIENLEVMLPSGTGTTALFLQKYLPFRVLTCPCVGDVNYLMSQFRHLEPNLQKYPTVLVPKKKYHFGKLYTEFYELYKTLKKQTHIEFELLYDPLGFLTLQEHLKNKKEQSVTLYIHQGGVLGNPSMCERYERKISF
ncbi:1-aminocyclopropane-1-carboxylate deaminase/D-cysteine desulfhydrase [Candidatus Marinarcus aquaticus]|uniref:1-aminocyclopropane-1-carboxylate deaminase n=1 Tax=Candidatus Marinarcus aquaticus TaxID=2044504 RepID=A0A4Q0XPP9_9BACT|nr:1-aminocyclopropane-1-carboxylate deaminase/D-cysteine desulfhydrase [Candidatus Marinarcus aquaticus]RXJ57582.1 1-aminocyclopropane-1-carboxylate deaminase [Candidatus Marinarcus aquaticus]